MALEAALDPSLVVVSARAPFRLGPGYAWYDMAQVGNPDQDTFDTGLDELRQFVEDLPPAYDIDPQRLYLMGFSQGAIMSAALALVEPESVRGVIMHSGYVPAYSVDGIVPGGIEGKGFFVAHGLYDEVIPVIYGRESEAYLSRQGARLTYNEYPIGHSISEESLYDLSEWLSGELESNA
jgi:phospholipase/carboxylesterase